MDAARYTAAAVEAATGTRPEIFAFGWMDYYPPNVRGQETALQAELCLQRDAELTSWSFHFEDRFQRTHACLCV